MNDAKKRYRALGRVIQDTFHGQSHANEGHCCTCGAGRGECVCSYTGADPEWVPQGAECPVPDTCPRCSAAPNRKDEQ